MSLTVVGVDLSLTGTGIADVSAEWCELVRPKKLAGFPRLRFIRAEVLDRCRQADLVVVEGPSHNSKSQQHTLGGLWYFVAEILDAQHIPTAVVAPNALKKYATGVGAGPRSSKDFVLAQAVRRFGWFDGDNNQADACWLSAMGYDYLESPVTDMPKVHREALVNVSWPQLV